MATFLLEDLTGSVSIVVFPNTYRSLNYIRDDEMVLVRGRLDRRREGLQLIASDIFLLEEARQKMVKKVIFHLSAVGFEDGLLERLKTAITGNKGNCRVQFDIDTPRHGKVSIISDEKISLTNDFLRQVESIIGRDSISFQVVQ